jgi:glycosyltransferase involved in cell wall biosynthesis
MVFHLPAHTRDAEHYALEQSLARAPARRIRRKALTALTSSSRDTRLARVSDIIRVLHVVGGMNRAGAETWLMNILRRTDHERLRMDFVVHSEQNFAYADECRSLGSQLLLCESPRRPLRYAHNFRRILTQSGRYDVVHSHVGRFSGYVLRLAHESGVPVRIAHSHSDTSEIDERAGPLRRAYLALTRRWIMQHATCLLAVTKASGRSLYGLTVEMDPRFQILPIRLDLSQFAAPADRSQQRAALGLPVDAFVIGHVGRFSHPKNHRFLIAVAAEVARRIPETHLLLVGVGALQEEIKRLITEVGLDNRVVFAGSRNDVPRVLAAMDVFVFPSLYEGYPLALIEAQAAGLPCVISDSITDEADVVKPLIRRLSLSDPSGAWADAIELIGQHSRTLKSAANALEIVTTQRGDVQAGVDELTSVYESALQRDILS